MKYWDSKIVYHPDTIEGILQSLSRAGFGAAFVAFGRQNLRAASEFSDMAGQYRVDCYTRYDIPAKGVPSMNDEISELRSRVDILAITRIPRDSRLRRLKEADIVAVDASSPFRLERLIKMGKARAVELQLRAISTSVHQDQGRFQRVVRAASLLARRDIPFVVSSGAQDPLDVKPPLQLLYTFHALTRTEPRGKAWVASTAKGLVATRGGSH
ncbi:MAG: hypothetical protein ACE5KH_01230 [Candidatus Geothermarchaeales archaeon]